MKKFMLAVALFAFGAGASNAADVYGGSMKDGNAPSIERVEAAKSFAGAYVGVSLSWDRMDVDHSASLSFVPSDPEKDVYTTDTYPLGSADGDGLGYGVVAGYNWQIGRIYFGPQVTLEGSELSSSLKINESGASATIDVDNTWRAGFLGKLGVQVIDRVGVYGKAGYMIGGFDVSGKAKDGNGQTITGFSDDDSVGGFAFGAGVDVKLSDRWTLSADWTRWNPDDVKTGGTLFSAPAGSIDINHTTEIEAIDIAKVTLTYTFN